MVRMASDQLTEPIVLSGAGAENELKQQGDHLCPHPIRTQPPGFGNEPPGFFEVVGFQHQQCILRIVITLFRIELNQGDEAALCFCKPELIEQNLKLEFQDTLTSRSQAVRPFQERPGNLVVTQLVLNLCGRGEGIDSVGVEGNNLSGFYFGALKAPPLQEKGQLLQ